MAYKLESRLASKRVPDEKVVDDERTANVECLPLFSKPSIAVAFAV